MCMLYILYYGNNDIIHINICYIHFYITFQYIHHMPSGISCGGSGPGMSQGKPQTMHLYFYISYIV